MKKAPLRVVACVLSRSNGRGGLTLSQTVTYGRFTSEHEAKGRALDFAMKEKPGFAVDIVTVCVVDGD